MSQKVQSCIEVLPQIAISSKHKRYICSKICRETYISVFSVILLICWIRFLLDYIGLSVKYSPCGAFCCDARTAFCFTKLYGRGVVRLIPFSGCTVALFGAVLLGNVLFIVLQLFPMWPRILSTVALVSYKFGWISDDSLCNFTVW